MAITLGQTAYVTQGQFVSNTQHTVKPQVSTIASGSKAVFGLFVAAGISGLTCLDTAAGTVNNWVVDVLSVGGAAAVAIIRCDVVTPILTTDSITASWTTAGTSRGDLFELVGAATGGPDQSLNTYGFTTTTALDTGSMSATSVAGCFIYALFTGVTTSTTFTAGNDGQGNSFTQGASQNAASRIYGSEYILSEASALAFKGTGTLGANNTGRGAIVAYKPVTGSAPANTVAPAVTGNPQVGQTLSTTDGTWTGSPSPTFTYQWKDGSGNIGGATSNTYVVGSGEATKSIHCTVTGTNTNGSASADSNTVGPIGLRYDVGSDVARLELCDSGQAEYNSAYSAGRDISILELGDLSHASYAQPGVGQFLSLMGAGQA
jgi:hypothetical protein